MLHLLDHDVVFQGTLKVLVFVLDLVELIDVCTLEVVDLIFESLDLNFVEFLLISLFLEAVRLNTQHINLRHIPLLLKLQ